MIALILKYYVIGVAMAAPIGPMSIIIMRRTLNNGMASGLASGLGTTTIEALYAALIAFGLSFISDFIILHKVTFGLMGGTMLVYFGAKIFFSPAQKQTQSTNIKAKHVTLLRDYLSNVAMTAVNPMTIFSFVAIFMGLGFGNMNGDYKAAAFAVLGLALGSTTWYSSYVGLINFARKKINERIIKIINHVSGLMIIGFGLLAFWKILG